MKIWHPVLALIVVGSAVAYHLVEARRHDAQLDQVRADLVSLSTSVAEAERVAAKEKPRVSSSPVVIAAAPAVEEEPAPQRDPSASPTSTGTAERHDIEPAEVRAGLEITFASETADPEWTTHAQSTAKTKLTATLPETSQLRSLECRASMCRFETVHEDVNMVHQFMQRALMDSETQIWEGGFFSTRVPEVGTDKLVMVTYLAREGESLDPVRLPQ